MLELRNLLVTEYRYRLDELDEMPLYELEMTSLIAAQSTKNNQG